MNKIIPFVFIAVFVVLMAFTSEKHDFPELSLRALYTQPPEKWPAPQLDSGVRLIELGKLPQSPAHAKRDSLKNLVRLGKTLFFDPRLSGSNKISCGSCHNPDLNWADGKPLGVGHNNQLGNRNSPSLENVWFFKKLFWDGRAENLAEQAKGPIANPIEMHQDLNSLAPKLSKIKGYKPLFAAAYGDAKITTDRIANAISSFEQTIVSGKSNFDRFLEGDQKAMSDQQILGLHVFRTSGKCLNCHNGPLFTDGEFYNLGLTYYENKKYEDLGLYLTTKKPEDVGKFKTPGLRNVMRTGPWMHNGLMTDMQQLLSEYQMGFRQPDPFPGQEKDPLYPKVSPHISTLNLTIRQQRALFAFLESLSSVSPKVTLPVLPK